MLAANRDAPSHVERVGLSGTVVSTDENPSKRKEKCVNKGRGVTGMEKKQTWDNVLLGTADSNGAFGCDGLAQFCLSGEEVSTQNEIQKKDRR